jgi:hypothetical protein
MTWVIGASSVFGFGTMISDVAVRFADGSTADLVQKTHVVSYSIAAGFAGSVKIGFALIGRLKLALPVQDPDGAYRPEVVAKEFAPMAARIFSEAEPEERRPGCHVLLVGVSPVELVGRSRNLRRAYVIRLASPTFEPGIAGRQPAVLHIGTGSKLPALKAMLRTELGFQSVRRDALGAEFTATVFASNIGKTIAKAEGSGLSPHVHVATVRIGELMFGNNDHSVHHNDGRVTDFIMPKVAASYAEFVELCHLRAARAGAAVA